MTVQSLLTEPGRVDEPRAAEEYADVLSQVAAARRPVIVRRNGEDFAAFIPLEHLELTHSGQVANLPHGPITVPAPAPAARRPAAPPAARQRRQ